MKVVRFHLICESLYDKWKSGFMKKNIIGILYFFVHFIIEVTSFYIVTYYSTTTVAWILALAYDFFAFVPQGFFGFLKFWEPKYIEKDIKRHKRIRRKLNVKGIEINPSWINNV